MKLLSKILLQTFIVVLIADAQATSHLTTAGKAFYDKYATNINYQNHNYNEMSYTGYNISQPTYLPSLPIRHEPLKNLLLSAYVIGNVNVIEHNSYQAEGQLDPIIAYRFNEKWQFQSLVEFNVNTAGDRQTTIEYAYIDWQSSPRSNFLGGKFLSPIGKFMNTMYLPWLNKLPDNPPGFEDDEAAPLANVGIQARGTFPLDAATSFNYSVFVSTGQQSVISDGSFSHISSRGYISEAEGNKILGGRLAFLPINPLEIGVSGAIGDVSVVENGATINTSRSYSVFDTDINYVQGDLDLRAEYTQQLVASHQASQASNSAKWDAWYGQAAYKFFSSHLEGVLRYGYYSTPDTSEKKHQAVLGINYWFTQVVVAKIACEMNYGKQGSDASANALLAQLVIGL